MERIKTAKAIAGFLGALFSFERNQKINAAEMPVKVGEILARQSPTSL
jgi:hypothetical protein